MCRIIEPNQPGGHIHVSEPLEAAELLRDNLVQELASMADLAAHWHMMEDEPSRSALSFAVAHKRKAIAALYEALVAAEERAFGEEHAHDQAHGHSHEQDHAHHG